MLFICDCLQGQRLLTLFGQTLPVLNDSHIKLTGVFPLAHCVCCPLLLWIFRNGLSQSAAQAHTRGAHCHQVPQTVPCKAAFLLIGPQPTLLCGTHPSCHRILYFTSGPVSPCLQPAPVSLRSKQPCSPVSHRCPGG